MVFGNVKKSVLGVFNKEEGMPLLTLLPALLFRIPAAFECVEKDEEGKKSPEMESRHCLGVFL